MPLKVCSATGEQSRDYVDSVKSVTRPPCDQHLKIVSGDLYKQKACSNVYASCTNVQPSKRVEVSFTEVVTEV